MGCVIAASGSEITSHEIGISSILRDQGSGGTITVGQEDSNLPCFWNQDQKFGANMRSAVKKKKIFALPP